MHDATTRRDESGNEHYDRATAEHVARETASAERREYVVYHYPTSDLFPEWAHFSCPASEAGRLTSGVVVARTT